MDRNREAQTHHHAARIRFHRLVDELADLREFGDFREPEIDLFRGKSQNRRIQVYVLAAGEFGVESGAEFEESCHAAVNGDGPCAGLQNARADLEECALTATILADDAKRFAAVDLEREIPQRPIIVVVLAAVEAR